MADDLENLHVRLQALHERLSSAKNVDPELRARLDQLIQDIEGHMGKPAERSTTSELPLVQQFTDMSERFEVTHPILAGTLGRMADVLSQMGI